ncbi:Tn3 family transposase [Clostridium gasigenes]|uniref:Tn3 family transposase n=1 Tax=Clostridium gasigenes TaxID=94869 RepID=UPI001C0CD06A|nr:Tn3 family transposase [Clostridium gasigenes]MBU3134527.1 Tn3 family transposase [Clostridium gasigenes]
MTKEDVNDDFLKHVSPLGWEHINFIGQYNFDYNLVDNMRPFERNLTISAIWNYMS